MFTKKGTDRRNWSRSWENTNYGRGNLFSHLAWGQGFLQHTHKEQQSVGSVLRNMLCWVSSAENGIEVTSLDISKVGDPTLVQDITKWDNITYLPRNIKLKAAGVPCTENSRAKKFGIGTCSMPMALQKKKPWK